MTSTMHPASAAGRDAATAVRRVVNDEILHAAERFHDEAALFEFVCECGYLKCRDFVKLTLAEYRATTPGTVVANS
jgi:hypothetical protein